MKPDYCLGNLRQATLTASVLLALWMHSDATASELVEVQPLTERILMLHFNDGHVQHHLRGEPRSAEKVFTDPLDVVAAARAESYTVTSADDPAYRQKRLPLSVGRKSKALTSRGSWTSGRMGGREPSPRPQQGTLDLSRTPTAMLEGRTYTVGTGDWPGTERTGR